ncbi:MAG TPA: hypothetical protein VML95_05015 [Longimicrobiales bacterium]|nr:hypothetical protein [Longimicrobiales bacterium]
MGLVWAALLVGIGAGIALMLGEDMFGGVMVMIAGAIAAIILYRRAARRRT